MKKNKIILALLFLALVMFLFYWFQWRPIEIRKECGLKIFEQGKKEQWEAWKTNNRYRVCLIQKGMKPESMLVNTE